MFFTVNIYYLTHTAAIRGWFYSVVVITPDFEAKFVFRKLPATPVRTRVRPLLLLVLRSFFPPSFSTSLRLSGEGLFTCVTLGISHNFLF